MSELLQAIAVPVLLAISLAYLVFVGWASHRRREEAEAERIALKPEPAPEADAEPARTPEA